MLRKSRFPSIDTSTKIRLAFAVLAAFIAVRGSEFADLAPWLFLVVVLDLVVVALDRMPISRRGVLDTVVLTLLAVDAAAAGIGYAFVGLSAALLILIPAYHAGTRFGRFGFLLSCVVGAGAYLSVVFTTEGKAQVDIGMVGWLGAALLLGGLGVWNQRLVEEQELEADPAAREAVELIQRLRDLSSEMSTGFDAPASASLALDLLAASVPSTRSAVLVTEDSEHLVPVALRGSTRAPWHVAEDVTRILDQNPTKWKPTEVGFVDEYGRRQALVTPFAFGEGPATVVVVERSVDQPFTDWEKKATLDLTRRLAPTVQAGLLFGNLKQYASLEERNRIARDIHDGIAQELAALGYSVDALRMQAGSPGTPMRDGLDALRDQLSEAMADLRLHITDLRVAERPGSGLGAVLGGAVQSFGSMTGVRTTVSVSEGRRRLDPQVEILIHRLVMDVLADAQASGARNAWVTLNTSVAGPATVEVSHDGDPDRAKRLFRQPNLGDLEGQLSLTSETNGRTTVSLSIEQPQRVGAVGSP